jgi:hypothetical protein
MFVRHMSKPTIPDVLPIARKYYDTHPAGGSLHIYLDDGNTSDGNIEFCLKYARQEHDEEGAALATLLLQMSQTQRTKLYHLLRRPAESANKRK